MDKKADILNATLKLTTQMGFVGTSTALIAEEAKVGVGTIYRYFESKEHLFSDLFNELKDKFKLVILSSFSTNKTAYENFELIIYNLFNYYIDHIEEFRYLEIYSDSPYTIKERLDDTSLSLEPIANLFSSLDKSLQLKPLPLEVIFAMIYGPLISIVNLVHLNKIELDDQLISDIAKSCWDAIIKK